MKICAFQLIYSIFHRPRIDGSRFLKDTSISKLLAVLYYNAKRVVSSAKSERSIAPKRSHVNKHIIIRPTRAGGDTESYISLAQKDSVVHVIPNEL